MSTSTISSAAPSAPGGTPAGPTKDATRALSVNTAGETVVDIPVESDGQLVDDAAHGAEAEHGANAPKG